MTKYLKDLVGKPGSQGVKVLVSIAGAVADYLHVGCESQRSPSLILHDRVSPWL